MTTASGLDRVAAQVPEADALSSARPDAAAEVGPKGRRRLGDGYGGDTALGNLGVAVREVRRFEEAITACRDAAALPSRA